MNRSSPLSASFLGHHGNHGSKGEHLSLESTDTTEPFLRYTEDPLAKTKSRRPRPRQPARMEVSKGIKTTLQHDCQITDNKPKCDAQFLAPNPYIHCKGTDTDSKNVVDEMAPQKLKEDLIQYNSSSLNVIQNPVSQEPRLTGLELSKRFNSRQQEVKKLENVRTNDYSVIPTYEGSDDENGSMGFVIAESVVRYVKDPLTRNDESQKTIAIRLLESRNDTQDFGTFEQLAPDQKDDDIEDVFLDFNSDCQGDSVPDTKAGKKNYVDSNTPSPSVVVFRPIEDIPLSSVIKEPHFLGSLEPYSIITSEGIRLSKETGSNVSGRRLSYFSYLGDDLNKSWSRSSTTSSFNNSGILREISVSSCTNSSSRSFSNASSPSSNPQSQFVAEFDGPDKLDQIIDYCSCMCCMKALFYHCTKDDDCDSTYGEPYQCEQPSNKCLKRWGFLSVLTCCMPCLLFYAPLKGLQKAAKRTKRFFRRKHKSKSYE